MHRQPLLPTRRQLLQVGGLSLLGLSLPKLLQASAPGTRGASRGPEKSCILITLLGGLSHIDSFDMKPDSPDGIRGPFKPMATAVPGTQICELLPQLARQAGRYCLIRSMTNPVTGDGHISQINAFLSGSNTRVTDLNTPLLGSVVAKCRPSQRNLPSYVWLQEGLDERTPAHFSGGFLGASHAPLRLGTTRDHPAHAGFRMTAFDPTTDLTPQRLHTRHQLLQNLEAAGVGRQTPPARSMQTFQERALDLVAGPDARRAFDLEREPTTLRDRYGRFATGQNLLLARRLVESGVRLVSVNAWMGDFPGRQPDPRTTWDMHAANGNLFANDHPMGLGYTLPRLDQALAALLDDLTQRGLLDSTLVVVAGEFGRTPKHNMYDGKGPGREHWEPCYSGLIAGAGIRGGLVYGASDKIGAFVKERPVAPADLAATIYRALGVSPETPLARPDGLAIPASKGQPILEMFA